MSIRETLEQFADGWKKLNTNPMARYEEFVLEYGKTYHNVEVGLRGEKKECFCNAGRAVIRHGHLVYVEGYCSHKEFGLPLMHAWVEDRYTGTAHEVTLDDPESMEYFGIRYQTEFVLKQMAKHKVWGVLGGHPQTARDLMTGVIPPEEFLL